MPPSRSGRAGDLEEIAPNRFIIHTPRMAMLLKDDGVVSGHLFTLTTWRRDGLIARLRARTFVVRTLADQLAALPAPPEPAAIAEPRWRPIGTAADRYSRFDPDALAWQPLETEARNGESGVMVAPGWVVRRRKGRNPATYYQAVPERFGVALRSVEETAALLAGYAQAGERGVVVRAARHGEGYALPNVELPLRYRAWLRRCGSEADGALVVNQLGWALAQEGFAQLGVRLAAEE